MNRYKLKKALRALCFSAVLGTELLLLADAALVLLGGALSISMAAMLWAALVLACGFLLRWKEKRLRRLAIAIPAVIAGAALLTGICWYSFSAQAEYEFPDDGKGQLYADKTVMVVVPHQDDELNVLGGVMEEYIRYGSRVYPVFVTNGDKIKPAETRLQEALDVFSSLGVAEEQVTFLGYGNEWKEDGPHLYNAAPGVMLESYAGRTETHGTPAHPAYREGRAYAVENLKDDLKSIILEIRPEVIFCSDYDNHIDHKAVTLLFEKVMGEILKENPDYTPIVYKAYAYGTAWEAEADYYGDNILSTKNPFAEPYSQKPAVYRWEDRVRFPVSGATLSRSLVSSGGYGLLKLHRSQGAQLMAGSVLNGDKVAWRRNTDSLCLRAEVKVSSGEGEFLHDFMLLENENLTDESRMPYDGVWIPEDDDRRAAVTLEASADLDTIVLYDHPDPAQNVRNAVILFDDGTWLETGPLDIGGAATAVKVGKKDVSAFLVMLIETEGTEAGLTEIEAFSEPQTPDGSFAKLTDAEGNFLYDYQTAADGTAVLSLYGQGSLSEEEWVLAADGEAGTAVWEDGMIRVTCPVGEKFVLRVTGQESGISDSIVVRNPGQAARRWQALWQKAEETLYSLYCQNLQARLLIPSVCEKIAYVIRHMN